MVCNWNRVAVELEDDTKTEGGLYMPATAEKATVRRAKVVATRDKAVHGGLLVDLDFTVGSTVLISAYGVDKTTVDGREVVIVRTEDILARL